MKKKLLREAVLYGAITVVTAVLSVAVSYYFVFLSVIFGIMFISCFGGALFSADKKEKQSTVSPKGPVKSPFVVTQEDIQAQIDNLTALYEKGEITADMYEEEKKVLESYLSKAI